MSQYVTCHYIRDFNQSEESIVSSDQSQVDNDSSHQHEHCSCHVSASVFSHLILQPTHSKAELQRRSSKVFDKCSLKSFLWVGNLYQSSTTLGLEPVSIIHYTRPGTCINCPLHYAWIKYQAAHPELISYIMPCKLACLKVATKSWIKNQWPSP